jgi:hypothetical protein
MGGLHDLIKTELARRDDGPDRRTVLTYIVWNGDPDAISDVEEAAAAIVKLPTATTVR